ncbi:MAG: amino acid adenylation domain-containing protein [Nitrospira sp.]|nr:amino acid adenylation domain-containing protein [Nitrospira sp.]
MAKSALPDHINSIYPLSPMQEGMLFHTLMNPGTGIYLMQNRYLLEGDLNYDAFVRAWDVVLDRHPVLRTSFLWKNQKRPLQAVHKRVDMPIVSMDWRGQTRPEQIARLDAELETELREGFDFAKAPLMRLWLIRLADDRYQFVHSFHHILLDEWCISLLLMDFLGHYGSLVRGERLTRARPRPYHDYIAWLQKQDITAAESFWRGYLKNFPTPTPLPYDRLPEGLADQNEDAADHCLHLSADTSATLVDLAQRHRLTVNTFFQGAWALLLSYYSSEREVLFGVTVAGRPTELPGVESILGLFINTLPLRISMQPDRPLMDWLKDLLAENVRVRQYDYAPLVQVQRWSEVPRGEALFHSLFVFENAPVDRELCEGRIIFKGEEEQYRVHTNYPLTVMGWPGRELGLKISYDKRLFDADTTGRMIRHFKTLLEAMAEQPTARLVDLSPLKQDERRQLLTDWNPEVVAAGEEQSESLPRLFEEQVERRPDAVVVECLEEKATYRELNRRANRVAHALAEAGVQPDTVVALLDDRGIDLLTMMLGVFKAGGAYLPIDPHHPVSRLTQILKLSRSSVVLTSQDYLARLQEAVVQIDEASRPRLMPIERILDEAGREDNPGDRGQSEHLAYVIYTSGSTGVPKGAMVTRRGMLNNIRSKVSGLALGPADVIAQTASQCFDISVWQFLTALTCGARTSIVPDDTSRDPFQLLTHLERADITILETVPALLQGLLDAGSEAGFDGAPRLEKLRWVLPTGEALPPPVCRQWLARYRSIPLLNAYGPAECADDVAVHPILEPPTADMTHMPIGCPIEGIRLHILNVWLEPVPPGVSGELYVAGVGVGRGYLQDPSRTAEVFLPDRFGSEPGARMYRTGDLARYRRDGAIEFVGRVDQQIKLRGFRIELGEIETHLLASPLVREAAVLLHTDARGEKRLAAYLAGHEEGGLNVSALRDLLSSQLPEYMVPTAFVPVPALPRTPNGKIDRLALAALDLGDQFARSYTAPRTATEEILAGIWSDVLGVERVGVHDDFFELGGHSLLATQIMSRLRSTFHVELSLRIVFEATSVAALAAAVDRAWKDGAVIQGPPLVPVARTGPLPASFAQQRLWFLAQLEPDSPFYNLPAGFRLRGKLDVDLLTAGLNQVIARHEALRTVFHQTDGQPTQVVLSSMMVEIPVVDLREIPEEQRTVELTKQSEAEAQRIFDLTHGPLVRARVWHIGEEEYVLLMTLHHIVSDGWAMDVLIRELVTYYQAGVSGQPAALPPLPIQYADYAVWQRDWMQGAVLETQLAYWKDRLGDAPAALELPTDRPRPSVQTYRGSCCEFMVPGELVQQITALSRRHGLTLYMTLLTAFTALLRHYSGQTSILVGSPVANRLRIEVEELIGLFVNTLVLRTDIPDNPRWIDLLDRVRGEVLRAQSHQDLPFEYLVDALQPERNLSHSPLFQVMFTLQTPADQSMEPPGLRVDNMEIEPGTTLFDLSLDMVLEPDRLSGSFEYSTDLFADETIARMVRHFQELLRQIVLNPEARVSALGLLSQDESRHVLEDCNKTTAPYPRESCLHHLFEEQARLTPDAIAMVWNGASYSYRFLNERANQLARYLRSQGIAMESRVALCMERSLEMVAGLLGILKAGAAYVPMDPLYPRERLRFMIEDSGAQLVLTQQQFLDKFQNRTVPIIALDESWPSVAALSDIDSRWHTTPENLAYILYTSGTTGEPKGIEISHRALVNHSTAMARHYGLQPTDRVLQFASISFDVAAEECFPTWAAGATVVLRPNESVPAFADFEQFIADHGLTVLNLPTPYWAEWIEAMEQTDTTLPHAIRLVIVGSEKALPESLVRWQRLAGARIAWCNSYGPTETTITASYFMPERQKDWSAASTVPIGRPIANVQLYVLNPALQPVPIGVAGELYIGGAGVARGYHRQPARTAEQFIPDCFSREPGARLYRTGDRVRRLADDNLEFLGRYDDQIKIRGFRVEPAEIELWLKRHPAVKDALVLQELNEQPGGARRGESRLMGCVVPRIDNATTAQDLRSFLAERLPRYMIPAAWIFLDTLPLTSRGKVDRQALRALAGRIQKTEPVSAPLQTDTEQAIADIWKEILGLEAVGRHDNFFDLGGDSIASLQVIARAKQVGLLFSPRQIFQYQTVAELAAVAGREAVVALEAEQGAVTGEAPLTPIQRAFFELPLVNLHHWNQSVLLEAKEPLVESALEAAVTALIAHHDALRLRFVQTDDGWRQSHAPIPQGPLVCRVNLAALSDSERRAAFEAQATQWQGSLHISEGPLLHVVWFEMGDGLSDRLLIAVHHLAVDGVSWRILLEDLQTFYRQAVENRPIQLPPKTTSFRQWAERLRRYAETEVTKDLPSIFWPTTAGERSIVLPVDDPTGSNREAASETLTVSLDERDTQALLHDVSAAYGTQINDVLLTALAQTLGWWIGLDRVTVDLEGHGREDLFPELDISRTVGWFTSVFPVTLDVTRSESPGEALKSVKEQLRKIPGHGIGYGIVRYLTKNGLDSARARPAPRVPVGFNYLGQFDAVATEESAFVLSTESVGKEQDPRNPMEYELDINASVVNGCLEVMWTYSRERYRSCTITSLATAYLSDLRKLIAHCLSTDAGGYTPSDFPDVELEQDALDAILEQMN